MKTRVALLSCLVTGSVMMSVMLNSVASMLETVLIEDVRMKITAT